MKSLGKNGIRGILSSQWVKINAIALLAMFLHFNVVLPYIGNEDLSNNIELCEEEEESKEENKEEELETEYDIVNSYPSLSLFHSHSLPIVNSNNKYLIHTHIEVFTPPPELL